MANPLSQIQFAVPFTDIRADTAVNATSARVRRFFHPGWAAVRLVIRLEGDDAARSAFDGTRRAPQVIEDVDQQHHGIAARLL